MNEQNTISFDNTEYAFAAKTNKGLKKANFIFSVMGKPWLVKAGLKITPLGIKWHIPFTKTLIRKTIFQQFVGGETLEETAKVVDKLEKYNVQVILDYGVEGKEGEDNFEHARDEFIKVIAYASTQANIPFMSVKVTGFARFSLLEKLHGEMNRAPGTLMKRYLNAVGILSVEEKDEWHRVRLRTQKVCEEGARKNVGVLIDAEETWIQDPVDALTILMMDIFNKEKAVVYNTLQLYRHDRLVFLKDCYTAAVGRDFILGTKLVRGAYMEKERNRAVAMNYTSPIQPDKEACDRDYNAAVEFCIEHIDKIAVIVASHNEYSNLYPTQLLDKKGLPHDHPHVHFSQLYGMSDNITFNLAKAGCSVSKYLPFGPIKDVIPYLMRRAQENSSVSGQTGKELGLIKKRNAAQEDVILPAYHFNKTGYRLVDVYDNKLSLTDIPMLIRLSFILPVFLYLLPSVTNAQVRKIPAVKINQPIKIDGNLDDEAWKNIKATGDFITSSPVFGKPSTHKTAVKIAYDNTAIYVGAYMYDKPENIRKQITARDVLDRQDVDYFVVGFDTYHDRQNSFVFRVSAAGVQGDAKESNGGAVFDVTWDAVWESMTSIKADGWVAEIKIPFSAIRFPKSAEQKWGLNFARFIRKENENSIWNPVNPNINGDVNQWGDWTGIKNITPPIRLSFLPYLSGGVRVSPTANGDVTEFLKSGGMDVKYGLNSGFTLDMTLVPDFAQVQSDNIFLNLTPFQVKFDDYRPFFTEGTELFNKSGLFYSRRIGDAPALSDSVLNNYGNDPNYKILKNPGITRLYNATKFSGRTTGNLGIGVFNAVSVPMYAKVEDLRNGKDSSILTEPLTNYNIIVLDQALNNRSSVSFTNTNVLRRGNSRNANVSSIDLSLFDKKNNHNLSFTGKYSSIWGTLGNKNGFTTVAGFGKISGLIQYRGAVSVESDKYDPNDLGYIQNNNSVAYDASISYNMIRPTRHFLNHNFKISLNDTYLYKPFEWASFQVNANAFFLFKNFWDISFSFTSSPTWNKDYFVQSNVYSGYFLRRTPFYFLGTNGSSDSRKKLYFEWTLGGAESPLPNDPYWTTSVGLRYRFNNKLQVSGSYMVEQDRGNWGWAFITNPNGSPVIGRRNVKRNTSVLSAQYNFNSKMNVNIRVRHYWSILENTNFYDLKPDGYWNEIAFIPGQNVNFNTFNIDMFYTWDFLLGSRLTIAWKNALGGNVVIDPYTNMTYSRNFGKVIDNPHSNEITVKIVYFLDYLRLKRKQGR